MPAGCYTLYKYKIQDTSSNYSVISKLKAQGKISVNVSLG